MKVFLIIVILSITISSCKKEITTEQPTVKPLVYTSLVAENTTVSVTQPPKITATAIGESLTYTWSLDGTGNLLGSGNQITYQPCCAGQKTISCEVKDSGGNKESKSVTIIVQ